MWERIPQLSYVLCEGGWNQRTIEMDSLAMKAIMATAHRVQDTDKYEASSILLSTIARALLGTSFLHIPLLCLILQSSHTFHFPVADFRMAFLLGRHVLFLALAQNFFIPASLPRHVIFDKSVLILPILSYIFHVTFFIFVLCLYLYFF